MVFKCACMHSGVNKMVGFDERVNWDDLDFFMKVKKEVL